MIYSNSEVVVAVMRYMERLDQRQSAKDIWRNYFLKLINSPGTYMRKPRSRKSMWLFVPWAYAPCFTEVGDRAVYLYKPPREIL